MEHNRPTLLQVINNRFAVNVLGRSSIAQSLGMSDSEFAEAERRGFTEREAQMIKRAVVSLGFRLHQPRGGQTLRE